MELRSVAYAQKPKYPDKYEIELDKTLLEHRPRAWFAKPIVGLALSAIMAAGLTGCVQGLTLNCDGEPDDWGTSPGVPPPPVFFLSDHDALTVIADELSKSGFGFEQNIEEPSDGDVDFAFDGYFLNGESKIDVEYVSANDYETQKYPGLTYLPRSNSYNRYGAYGDYNTEGAAAQLKDLYPDAAFFYDPMTDWNELSSQELRAQVIDFIEWLISVGNE